MRPKYPSDKTILKRIGLSRATTLNHRGEADLIFQNNPHNAECRSSKSKWILTPSRLLANCPESNKRINLISQGHGNRNWRSGYNIRRALWFIVLGNGIGDFNRLARLQRIIPPHNALQFGEFVDHLRDEIGLTKVCGLSHQ